MSGGNAPSCTCAHGIIFAPRQMPCAGPQDNVRGGSRGTLSRGGLWLTSAVSFSSVRETLRSATAACSWMRGSGEERRITSGARPPACAIRFCRTVPASQYRRPTQYANASGTPRAVPAKQYSPGVRYARRRTLFSSLTERFRRSVAACSWIRSSACGAVLSSVLLAP